MPDERLRRWRSNHQPAQLIMPGSGIVAEMAAEGIGLLHQWRSGHHLKVTAQPTLLQATY
jgi:hypothetical protein